MDAVGKQPAEIKRPFCVAATSSGVILLQKKAAGWQETHHSLDGVPVTCVAVWKGIILAGTRQGIYRSDDLGATWRELNIGLTHKHIRWLAFHSGEDPFALAGTEPAAVFYASDSGERWHECPEVSEMREIYGWSLPYSPESGCVRGFAFSDSSNERRAYAAVEDGCVLISDDGGRHWKLASGSKGYPDHHPLTGFIHSDVHSIETHPSSSDMVYAPTGGGLYASSDGGASWRHLYPGCYCRAIWVDPITPSRLVFGPADGVEFNGRIEVSHDGGATWQLASTGLETPWRRHMVECFFQIEDELFAVLSNGELFVANINPAISGTLMWQNVPLGNSSVASIAALIR